jgi:hypothetical protein
VAGEFQTVFYVKDPDSGVLIVFCLGTKTAEMTIIVPGALFAAGISIYLFYEFNRVKEAKRDQRRESLNDKRQQYIHQLIQANKKEQKTEEGPARTEPGEREPETRET